MNFFPEENELSTSPKLNPVVPSPAKPAVSPKPKKSLSGVSADPEELVKKVVNDTTTHYTNICKSLTDASEFRLQATVKAVEKISKDFEDALRGVANGARNLIVAQNQTIEELLKCTKNLQTQLARVGVDKPEPVKEAKLPEFKPKRREAEPEKKPEKRKRGDDSESEIDLDESREVQASLARQAQRAQKPKQSAQDVARNVKAKKEVPLDDDLF